MEQKNIKDAQNKQITKVIAQKITRMRKMCCISQADIGICTGLHTQTITRLESGKHSIRVDVLVSLIEYFYNNLPEEDRDPELAALRQIIFPQFNNSK